MRIQNIDDVMIAGTAVLEAINITLKEGGILVGVIVAFDRPEKTQMPGPGQSVKSASGLVFRSNRF